MESAGVATPVFPDRDSRRIPRVTDDPFSLTAAQVHAAQLGDAKATSALFRRYMPRVRRIVAARLGREWHEVATSEDVVQESFIDALVALRGRKLTNEAAFCAWMAKCVQNNISDEARRARAEKRGGERVGPPSDQSESFLTESILGDDLHTPSQLAMANETEEQLEAALRGLGSRYREVISLRVYCGMSYREIAAAMELPSENTANVLFIRARTELRDKLGA